jgi:hypothetical protein
MTFTDLEYVLMIAVFALLWRNTAANMNAMREEARANKYANWMKDVYDKKGKIVEKDNGYYFEESK